MKTTPARPGPAVNFFRGGALRDPNARAARLAEQFINQNRSLTALLDVRIERDYDGGDVQLKIQAGSKVGAIPLFSRTSRASRLRPSDSAAIPLAWDSAPCLPRNGMANKPNAAPVLPLLRRSERRVPLRVLSFMILARLKALLDSLDRSVRDCTRNSPSTTRDGSLDRICVSGSFPRVLVGSPYPALFQISEMTDF